MPISENDVDKAATLMRTRKIAASAAARRVVREKGITYEPDVVRLSADICSRLGQRGSRARQARKRAQVRTPSLYRKPVQTELKL